MNDRKNQAMQIAQSQISIDSAPEIEILSVSNDIEQSAERKSERSDIDNALELPDRAVDSKEQNTFDVDLSLYIAPKFEHHENETDYEDKLVHNMHQFSSHFDNGAGSSTETAGHYMFMSESRKMPPPAPEFMAIPVAPDTAIRFY